MAEYIICKGGCNCVFGGTGGSKEALKQGWVWINGKYYCPSCAPTPAPKK